VSYTAKLTIPPEVIAIVDDWRWSKRIASRPEALRQLILLGLAGVIQSAPMESGEEVSPLRPGTFPPLPPDATDEEILADAQAKIAAAKAAAREREERNPRGAGRGH
jgi:hypothetical protein